MGLTWSGWPEGQKPPAKAKDWPTEAIHAEPAGPWLDWLALQAIYGPPVIVSKSDHIGELGIVEPGALTEWCLPGSKESYLDPHISSCLGAAGRALAAISKCGYQFNVSNGYHVSQCELTKLPIEDPFDPITFWAYADTSEPAVAIARAMALLAHGPQERTPSQRVIVASDIISAPTNDPSGVNFSDGDNARDGDL